MTRRIKLAFAGLGIVIAGLGTGLGLTATSASAGVSPTGFPAAAHGGIDSLLIKAYGSLSDSPYKVDPCTENHPGASYGNETVTCQVVYTP
jgi:hypothetical protein